MTHVSSWLYQVSGPSENQPSYGREFSRVVSIASLMLMLDAPKERKQKLMIGLVQLGIDLYGMTQCGRQWQGDGGHWSGRKWPILFAGLMLGDHDMQHLPPELIVVHIKFYCVTLGNVFMALRFAVPAFGKSSGPTPH